jgi:hypothetical protein
MRLMAFTPQVGVEPGADTPVMESCLMCGKPVPSSQPHGAGERAIFCGYHSAKDKHAGMLNVRQIALHRTATTKLLRAVDAANATRAGIAISQRKRAPRDGS